MQRRPAYLNPVAATVSLVKQQNPWLFAVCYHVPSPRPSIRFGNEAFLSTYLLDVLDLPLVYVSVRNIGSAYTSQACCFGVCNAAASFLRNGMLHFLDQ